MENKPRDYLAIEDEFCRSCNIISVQADLLASVDQGKCALADDTLENLGHTCYRESENLRALFYELIENQKQAK